MQNEIGNKLEFNETLVITTDTNVILKLKNMSFMEISDLNSREIEILNSNISYQGYFDSNFSKDCGIPNRHEELFKLFKAWIEIAGKYDIPWWLCCGTLIGSLRHKDIIPWDHDMDIEIPSQYEKLIRNISTPRNKITKDKVNIVTRPGHHCSYNGERLNCKGLSVSLQIDGCAFCGPLARIFYEPSKRIDIFLVDIVFHENQLKYTTESFYEYMNSPPFYPFDWYFPMRNCTLMGFKVKCPHKSEILLNEHYGTYKTKKKCINGKWKE